LQDLTALTCPTPFTSTSLGVFTPNSQIQICTFFLYYFCTLNYDIYIYILDYSWLHLFTLLILQLQWLFDKPVHRSPILLGSQSSSVLDLTQRARDPPSAFWVVGRCPLTRSVVLLVYIGSNSLTLGSLASLKPYRPTWWHRLCWNN
jgi:hypothetical protein